MPDVFLYAGEANAKDVRLSDPTVVRPAAGDPVGTLAATLADATIAATGTETFTATLASTFVGATSATSGTLTNTGTAATTLAGDTCVSAGSLTIPGASTSALSGGTSAAAGSVTVPGSSSVVLGSDTCAASGTVTSGEITGTGASTLDSATFSVSGTVSGGDSASGGTWGHVRNLVALVNRWFSPAIIVRGTAAASLDGPAPLILGSVTPPMVAGHVSASLGDSTGTMAGALSHRLAIVGSIDSGMRMSARVVIREDDEELAVLACLQMQIQRVAA